MQLSRVLCLAVPAALAALASASARQTPDPRPTREDLLSQQLVEVTNAERAKESLPPLKWNPSLQAAAMYLARDMAENDYFDHEDRRGRRVSGRLEQFDYRDWTAAAENIACMATTPKAAVIPWLRSPTHRANILSREFHEVGGGFAERDSSRWKRYWVQVFGRRRDVFPVVINGEEMRTRNPNVKLYLYGEGWAKQMRVSGNGLHWTPWEPFQSTLEVALKPVNGTHTVYVELTNGEATRSSQDSIELYGQPEPDAPRSGTADRQERL